MPPKELGKLEEGSLVPKKELMKQKRQNMNDGKTPGYVSTLKERTKFLLHLQRDETGVLQGDEHRLH